MACWIKRFISLVCTIAVVSVGFVAWADDAEETGVNRFNVVLVLDASGSMESTDPHGYRYDALEQFVFMLADTGNYLGCVVFDTDIRAQSELTAVNGQVDKNGVVETLESVSPNRGYTNIGDALTVAVNMIESSGNPNLPSVIVFLSDGNTDMPTDEQIQESLDAKADAIESARNDGISIYSVCLNANGAADTSEMQQISGATGGVFNEVAVAEDLQDVLSSFYSLIYRTTPIPIEPEVFPEDGIISKTFDIPGLGVEEANFLIYGQVSSIEVFDPSGNLYPIETLIDDTCAMTKVMNPIPGQCTVNVYGEPGTTIYGNMVYNVNLVVVGNSDLNQMTGSTSVPVNFTVQLGTGNVIAQDPAQYNGFSANLIISDAYGNQIDSVPMSLGDNGFVVSRSFDEGSYFYRFSVTGYNLDKESVDYGPFTIVAEPDPVPVVNTAPVPVLEEVEYTKYVIPFIENTLEIPVTDLATDAEDSSLVYQIESSAFIEGTDYTFDGNTITMTEFSLSKGDYVIKAIDSGGMSCQITIRVKAINVAVVTVIVIGIIAFLLLVAAAISLWYWKGRPLRGTLTIQDAGRNEVSAKAGRGQIRLNRLRISPTASAGFDTKKTYIQCTGKEYIYFVSNKKFVGGKARQPVKKVKITGNGNYVTVKLPNVESSINIKFQPMSKKGPGHTKSHAGGGFRGVGHSNASKGIGRRSGSHGIRR